MVYSKFICTYLNFLMIGSLRCPRQQLDGACINQPASKGGLRILTLRWTLYV